MFVRICNSFSPSCCWPCDDVPWHGVFATPGLHDGGGVMMW